MLTLIHDMLDHRCHKQQLKGIICFFLKQDFEWKQIYAGVVTFC